MNQRRDRKRERPDIVSFFSCCCHEREEGKKRGGISNTLCHEQTKMGQNYIVQVHHQQGGGEDERKEGRGRRRTR